MELNSYQKKVISQLNMYLELLNEKNNLEEAYITYWNNLDVPVGEKGLYPYINNIPKVPHVCFKVPTGGGKTFIACSSIKPIFDSMSFTKTKAVVWLVPSNAILSQTIKALKDSNHPYRQKIDVDFTNRVEVYTKTELLNGQNFNPTAVNEQLSIFVLSYDSLRSNNKESRKVYQENGNLSQFTRFHSSPETLLEDVDDSALIQVINQLSPIVIVDESHNATSDLSIEMIVNLNPSFVLDLTATPRKNSNIISIVDALELKKENMVKLPVIVYNRKKPKDVLIDAIDLRNNLEKMALQNEDKGGKYIRPIVLFQAEPKGKEDSQTFEKLKKDLIDIGIPEDYIAIKTSEVDEIKNVDLLDRDCSIRYIITVNALKEGWDCPFAYILATLANKSSTVDVEQILGRILRQPYANKYENPYLNMSYVLTASANFRETLENIVLGLNKAGFSSYDYRVAFNENTEINESQNMKDTTQISIFKDYSDEGQDKFDGQSQNTNEDVSVDINMENEIDNEVSLSHIIDEEDTKEIELSDLIDEEDLNEIKVSVENLENKSETEDLNNMLETALTENENYSQKVEEILDNEIDLNTLGVRDKMKVFEINEEFKEEVKNLRIPQFYVQEEPSLFSEEEFILLTKGRLEEGFILKDKDTQINFEALESELVKIDVEENSKSVPKYSKLSKADTRYFKEHFSKLPHENKIKQCKDIIYRQLNSLDSVSATDLKNYIDRIVDNMDKDQIENIEINLYSYSSKIKDKIKILLSIYREEKFDTLIELGTISCKDSYQFKNEISPLTTISTLPKSVYLEEKRMNDFEYKVINEIIALDNIVWWHCNIPQTGYSVNGFINHFPDFIVKTKKGKVVLVETKGDFLENPENMAKLKLGRTWQHKTIDNFRYYMVFENKDLGIEGAYSLGKFIEILKSL